MTREGKRILEGRTALITGGARRLGRTMASALARAGATVVVHYHESRDDARATAAGIEILGGRAFVVDGDLADHRVAPELCNRARDLSGGAVDILVNNASIFGAGSVASTTVPQWDAHQAVNLRAPFLLAQAFALQLKGDGPADIVNLNDSRALRPRDDFFAYTISKAGLHAMTQGLALALAPRVRVNELALGAVMPPEPSIEGYVHVKRDEIPLRRFGSADEVAAALLFVLGSPTLTGQTIFLDGGNHLV